MVGIHTVVRPRRRTALVVTALGAATALLALAGCSTGGSSANGSYGFPEAKQDTSSTITVWVDADRQAAAKAFEKAHPDTKIKVVTYDGSANGSNSFRTKIQLFDRAGSGWPDVVFSSQNNDASWASQKSNGKQAFAAVLDKGLVPKDTLSNFTPGALNPCTVSGQVYCLRNDLAQAVLWYNKSLMDQFGYTVPTTWEEYQALGEKVAKEHPGYLVGDAGDSFTPEIYLWASKCGANHITGPKSVSVNTSSEACTKMAKLMDVLIKNKSMSISGVFSTDFGKNEADKVLLMPGPAWYGGAVFKDTLKVPAQQIGVAPIPQWKGQTAPTTGNVGGGTWLLSAHSTNIKAATDFLTWVTTSDDYQAKLAPGYPAYASAARNWLAKQASSGYFANDIAAPLEAAANQVWPGWGYGQFSQEAIWAATVKPGLTQGKSIESMLPAWQDSIVKYAKSNGYKVSQ